MNSSLLHYCVILQQMNSADVSGLKYTFCKCVKSLILTVYYANLGSATLSSVRRVWGKNEVKHCFFLFYVKFLYFIFYFFKIGSLKVLSFDLIQPPTLPTFSCPPYLAISYVLFKTSRLIFIFG